MMFQQNDPYRILLENLPDAFAYHQMVYNPDGNPVDYIFLDVNPVFEEMTGLTRDSVMNRMVTEVLPGIENAPFDWIKTYGEVASSGKAARFEQFNEQISRWYEVTAYSDRPGYFATVFRDITRHIELENALQEGKRSYSLLLSNLPGMAYRCDFDKFWTMRFVSYGCYKLTGYLPEDLMENRAVSYNDLIKPEYRDLIWKRWSEVLAKREAFQAEYPIITAGGETKWVWEQGQGVYDEDGSIKALEGFVADITDRKQAEEELRKSEENLSITLQSIGDGVIATDGAGRVTRMNPQAEYLTGWSLAEAAGKQLSAIFKIFSAKTGKKAVNPVYSVIETGNRKAMANDTTLVAKDGVKRQIADSAAPIFDTDGRIQGVVMVFSDVTEQYKARQALKESEVRFRLLAENAQDIIYRFILYPQQRYEYISPSVSKIAGYTPEEHYANPELSFKIIHPDDRHLLERVVAGEIAFERPLTMRWVGKDGRVIWMDQRNVVIYDDFGRIVALEGIARDITELKQAENEVLRQKAHFEALFTNTKDAIVYFDKECNISNVNEQFVALFGYTHEEAVGKNLDATLNSINRMPDNASLYILEGENVEIESIRYHKSGQPVQVLLKGGPVYVGGEIAGGYAIYSDISDRKQTENELKFISMHDKLTGVYNRAFFEAKLNRLEARQEYPVTIMSVDVDGLKLINDTMGHDHGDNLLIACTKIIQQSMRSTDILSRVGGDEFIVILPGTDEKTGEQVVKRMQEAADNYNLNHPELPISISIGMATAVDAGKSLKEVFKAADDLMYNSKLHKGASAKSHIINTLMTTLGERDYITEGHGRRLSDLSIEMGVRIGLSLSQLDNLALLSQVHDLGKVGIPDHILNKNGPLTEEEWEIMRKHSEKGYRIAISSSDLAGVADLILKHHERWDGTGYPLGLNGRDIPIECRIISIVDAYDAMTSDRPYSKARSIEACLEEIQRCSGTQFDPELVDMFMAIVTNRLSQEDQCTQKE